MRLLELSFLLWICWAIGCQNRPHPTASALWPRQGRWLLIGTPQDRASSRRQADIVPLAQAEKVASALAGNDEEALERSLAAQAFDGVLLAGNAAAPEHADAPSSLLHALRNYASLVTLPAQALSSRLSIYRRRAPPRLAPAAQQQLTALTLALLRQETPPPGTVWPSFDASGEPLEIMVMLRQGGRPLVWRASRDASLARATTAAALAVRQRWRERQAAFHGALRQQLPQLQLEVAWLRRDGELIERHAAFMRRTITAEHGIGYDRRGRWQYALPGSLRQHAGESPWQAYRRLFRAQGLPADSHGRADLHLYRFVVVPLTTSRG